MCDSRITPLPVELWHSSRERRCCSDQADVLDRTDAEAGREFGRRWVDPSGHGEGNPVSEHVVAGMPATMIAFITG